MNVKDGFVGSAGVDRVRQVQADERLSNPDGAGIDGSCSSNCGVCSDILPHPIGLVDELDGVAQLRGGRRIADSTDASARTISRGEGGLTVDADNILARMAAGGAFCWRALVVGVLNEL